MKLSRAGVRALVVTAGTVAAVFVSGRAAQADCGRSAANVARPVYRDVEANPPATIAEARVAQGRLDQYRVLPCPDDATPGRESDYLVFVAWQRALDARAKARTYGSTYPDPRCAPVGRAVEREQLVVAYMGAFTRAFAAVKASPDAMHVADLIRREGRVIGLSLPPPWTFRNVARPDSVEPLSVAAHLPRGLICGT